MDLLLLSFSLLHKVFRKLNIFARYYCLNIDIPHFPSKVLDLYPSHYWSSIGDHTLSNSYFAFHSTGLSLVTIETQGQILPQKCSHTEVKKSSV